MPSNTPGTPHGWSRRAAPSTDSAARRRGTRSSTRSLRRPWTRCTRSRPPRHAPDHGSRASAGRNSAARAQGAFVTEPWILAVDLGTGGVKTGAVSLRGEVLAHAIGHLNTRYLPDGGAVQDPAEWWSRIVDGGRSVIEGKAVGAGDPPPVGPPRPGGSPVPRGAVSP